MTPPLLLAICRGATQTKVSLEGDHLPDPHIDTVELIIFEAMDTKFNTDLLSFAVLLGVQKI
jgi:hypothetical protein